MDASNRNTNRTNNRNEASFDNLVNKLEFLDNYGFYYQYCNNSRCRQVTLFILPSAVTLAKKKKKAFQKIADQANIPGIIIENTEEDRVTVTCVGLGVEKVLENQTWKQVLRLMANQQLKHERRSEAECSNYNHEPLPKGTWKNPDVPTRFSNEIRSIPGVRHIDTDGLLCCPKCLQTLFVVEASSDGCPGTPMANKFKATTMTRNIASMIEATPLLIQHAYDDSEHKHPAYLTSWTTGKAKRYKKTWKMLHKDFETAYQRHEEKACSKTK